MEGPDGPTFNWKYGVGFALGVIVTLVIIIVLANKYGKDCPSASTSTPPPVETPPAPTEPITRPGPNVALPDSPAQITPRGAEAYEPAPF